ncbi:MAG: hypothetical protein SFZ23_05860 [Planctomycetota bacterium]|nr:hypothetical protein [Planctomycetota bacterium]
MGPSEKSFKQVKDILGKLDRSIDQLRQQRNEPRADAGDGLLIGVGEGESSTPAPRGGTGASTPGNGVGGPSGVPARTVPVNTAPTRVSPYGRATPLPPSR